MKPGDIVTAMNGKTIEVNNTDAEGRLILADALCYAVEQGAERIVDLATLTGAIIVALGSTYAGLFSNDDDWCAEVEAAGEATGELGWRLPLHPEYLELTKGEYADLTNASDARKAPSSYAAEFLRQFVERHALGAHGHRRHRLGHWPPLRAQGRDGIRHAHADRAGPAGRGLLTPVRPVAAAALAAALLAGCGGPESLRRGGPHARVGPRAPGRRRSTPRRRCAPTRSRRAGSPARCAGALAARAPARRRAEPRHPGRAGRPRRVDAFSRTQ